MIPKQWMVQFEAFEAIGRLEDLTVLKLKISPRQLGSWAVSYVSMALYEYEI